MSDIIHCRYCNGERQTTPSGLCTGCGAPAANAKVHSPKKQESLAPKCPQCGGRKARALDKSWLCLKCGAEFDLSDLFILDDRPDVNAMKREAMQKAGRR